MSVFSNIYQLALVQPVYNIVMWLYSTLGQHQAGLTVLAVGLLWTLPFLPHILRGYSDQQRTRSLQDRIKEIENMQLSPEETQEKILQLLHQKNIHFQSESIFLAGQAVLLFLLYPVFVAHWQLEPNLLYPFVIGPDSFDPQFFAINLAHSSPTLSLVPTILLFFELRHSYREQKFLNGFIDRWYALILPLFVYFLIFWLPSGLALTLSVTLATSLYLRYLLDAFTGLRQRRAA